MDIVLLVIRQIIIMCIYMAIGYTLFKTKKITKEGSANMATLLVWVIIPVVITKSFCVVPTQERIHAMLLSALATVLVLGASLVISHVFFKKDPIANFGASFCNAGFLGVPLVAATVGEHAVFYIAFFVALLNIGQWVYGVALITNKKMKLDLPTLLHPLMLSVAIGLVLFFTGWGAKLPSVITGTMVGISGANAPLAMVVLGVYLAQADFKTLFTEKRLYFISFTRLILIPLVTLALLFGLKFLMPSMDNTIILALLLTGSAPVGANVAVYAQLHGKDYVYATKTVVNSTLLSLLTMPLMVLLAQLLLK